MNKTVLCIIDGLGVNPSTHGNAWAAAGMPNLDAVIRDYPSTTLVASGTRVGLANPDDAGNSEIGHNAIGAGQVIKQGLSLLNDQFKSGEIFQSATWKKLVDNAKKDGRKLNIITLLSDGRVHSDIKHLVRVIDQCKKQGVCVAIHALADGRDVATQSVTKYIGRLPILRDVPFAPTEGKVILSTLAGRAVSLMDRYESNIQAMITGFELMVNGVSPSIGEIGNRPLEQIIKAEYTKTPTMTDEALPPMIVDKNGLIRNGDSVLLLNYRGDRAVQTCRMFESGTYLTPAQFSKIDKCFFAGALQYDTELGLPKNYLCAPPVIQNGLTEWLCSHNVRQFTVTETVKFGHMTYFFNGNRTLPFDKRLETWKEVKGQGKDFHKTPEMKAREITAAAIEAIKNNKYDFVKLNLANPDMLGHTGNFDATVRALRVVDKCLGDLISACRDSGATLVITSDHGNAEEMLYADGSPKSAHTNHPVPFVVVSDNVRLRDGFDLTNIAATICDLLGIEKSKHFAQSVVII